MMRAAPMREKITAIATLPPLERPDEEVVALVDELVIIIGGPDELVVLVGGG